MKIKHPLLRTGVAWAASALLLAACGGGGGGGGAPAGSPQSFGPSSQLEGSVAGCTLATQKQFVRSYLDEAYLWYDEVPNVDPAAFSSIPGYFDALLTRALDSTGQPKDRFSAVLPLAQAQASLVQATPLKLDPSQLQQAGTGAFVPEVFTDTTGTGRRFGYIQFNDHAVGAQDQLITAFRQVRDQGVQDLVLDLRFNSGGFLYIAVTAASMVTGPASEGAVFERLRYNAKRSQESAQSTLVFSSSVQTAESQYPPGTALPQLGLRRVFVLTSGRTCSASESIINSLRGIDVQVVRIGSTTCGKPYGFRQKNNCGWAYFPVEFQGTNAKGFGDYTAGFSPNCEVQDNAAASAGSPADPLLAAAKFYVDNNACPSGTATGVQSTLTPIVSNEAPRRPAWAGRLLLPQQER